MCLLPCFKAVLTIILVVFWYQSKYGLFFYHLCGHNGQKCVSRFSNSKTMCPGNKSVGACILHSSENRTYTAEFRSLAIPRMLILACTSVVCVWWKIGRRCAPHSTAGAQKVVCCMSFCTNVWKDLAKLLDFGIILMFSWAQCTQFNHTPKLRCTLKISCVVSQEVGFDQSKKDGGGLSQRK